VALTTHGDPIVLEPPVATDLSATVAWGGTSPNVEVNRSLSDMIGQESGERYQMRFEGPDGFRRGPAARRARLTSDRPVSYFFSRRASPHR